MNHRTTIHAAVFFTFIAAWTVALLIPVPKETASRALGGEGGMHLFGKSLHIGAYLFLTLLGGSMSLTRKQRWLLFFGLSFHAFATEYLQSFVGRGSSLLDVCLDHIGIGLGVVFGWRWWSHLLPTHVES